VVDRLECADADGVTLRVVETSDMLLARDPERDIGDPDRLLNVLPVCGCAGRLDVVDRLELVDVEDVELLDDGRTGVTRDNAGDTYGLIEEEEPGIVGLLVRLVGRTEREHEALDHRVNRALPAAVC